MTFNISSMVTSLFKFSISGVSCGYYIFVKCHPFHPGFQIICRDLHSKNRSI